jgi:hypothetical protein
MSRKTGNRFCATCASGLRLTGGSGMTGSFGGGADVEAEPLRGIEGEARRALLFHRAPQGITPNTGQRPAAGGRVFHLWSAVYGAIS